MTFKYLLVVALVAFVVYVFLVPRRRGLRKGFLFAFVAIMLVFAIKPDWSTTIAQFFHVGRGADLLFYLSHLTLFFIAFVYYLKFKEIELQFTKLVRRLALDAAQEPLR